MQQIAISKGLMDWQKYPKNRKSITIQQPKTLDSKTCPTFPVMGGGTLVCISSNFKLNYLFYFFVPQVLVVEPAYTSNFIVFCNGVELGFMACACTFARAGVWSELAVSRNDLDIVDDIGSKHMVLAASRASSSASHCGKPLQINPFVCIHCTSTHCTLTACLFKFKAQLQNSAMPVLCKMASWQSQWWPGPATS